MNQPKSMLIVDDQIDFRESLARIFILMGYHVYLAENGREALDYLHAHQVPDLILLDLRMPGMCGRSFRKAQLRDPALSGIPVVIISGEAENLEQPFIGNARIWRKASDPRVLISLVEEICQNAPDAAGMQLRNCPHACSETEHSDQLEPAVASA